MGIHNKKDRIKSRLQKVKHSENLSESDKDYFQEVHKWLKKGSRSDSRVERYLSSLHSILRYHDFNFQPLTQEKFDDILFSIENSDYKIHGQGEYSPATKAEYRKLMKRLCEKEECLDILPKDNQGKIDFKTHVSKSEMKKTRPDQLPSVEDSKKIAQKIEEQSSEGTVLRNLSLFYVLYESGARIGEVLEIRKRDVEILDEKSIKIYITGNKDSDDRENLFVVSAPILKRYFQNHPEPDNPDAYLFCNIRQDQGRQMQYKAAKKILNRAGKAADVDAKFNPHVFRKKRISFMKVYLNMNEALIDKKVGHVPGSDTTRIYTRIDDQEMIDQYKQAYGLKDEDKPNPEKVHLWPQRCAGCGKLQSGHRDMCYSCGKVVDKAAFGDIEVHDDTPEKEEMMQRVENLLKERGIIDDISGDIK